MNNDLKFEYGWWLPKIDMHLIKAFSKGGGIRKGRSTYQYTKLKACLEIIPENRRRVVLDVGSNIGTWTYNLVDHFNYIHCFEPIKINRDCWIKNLEGYNNTVLYDVALGDENEQVKMFVPNVCTAWAYIVGSKNHDTSKPTEIHKDVTIFENITVERLDNYNFESVDFIKIDVEGYELNVLKGAKETILRNKPYILLEQKGGNLYGMKFLKNLGMYMIFTVQGDYLMGWDKATDRKAIHEFVELTRKNEPQIKIDFRKQDDSYLVEHRGEAVKW